MRKAFQAAVVNMCARGRACAAVAPHLAGAALFAGAKTGGGVRPLAAGETLQRSDLDAKRPGTGLRPERIGDLVGRTVSRDIGADRLVHESDLSS